MEQAKKGFKINPNHKGYCTPITKATCTGKRRTFALNAKHHFKKRKEDGGELPLTDNSIQLPDNSMSGSWNPQPIPTDVTKGYNEAKSDTALAEDPIAQQQMKPNSGLEPVSPQYIDTYHAPEEEQTNSPRQNRLGNFLGNTFNGVKSTDIVAGAVQGLNALVPNTPIRSNRKTLIDSYNPFPQGTGSHATFDKGGKMIKKEKPKKKDISTKIRGKRGNMIQNYADDGTTIDNAPTSIASPAPITPQERDAWEKMQGAAYQQGFRGDDHNRQPGVDFMKANGVDPTRLAVYQQDFQNMRGQEHILEDRAGGERVRAGANGFSNVDNFYGDKTSQQRYTNYTTEHYDSHGKLIPEDSKSFGTDRSSFLQTTDRLNANKNKGFEGLGDPKSDVNYKEPQPITNVPQAKPLGLESNGIPTREEAVNKYKARKASGKELPSNYFTGNKKRQSGDPIGDVRMGVVDEMYEGGYIEAMGEGGLKVENNNIEPISDKTGMLKGNKHTSGGTDIMYGNNKVEAESGEPVHVDPRDNSLIVSGNMTIPGSNIKFKNAMKKVGEQEKKISKVKDKATHLVNTSNDKDKFYAARFNTGKVLQDAIAQKEEAIDGTKNYLTDLQNGILEKANKGGLDPKEVANNIARYGKRIAKKGDKIDKDTPMTQVFDEQGHMTFVPDTDYKDQSTHSIASLPEFTVKTKKPIKSNGELSSDYMGMVQHPYSLEDLSGVSKMEPIETTRPKLLDTPIEEQALMQERTVPNIPKYNPGNDTVEKRKFKGLRNRLGISDILPEIATIFDQPEPVPSEQYNPQLYSSYQISLDDRIQANQGDFNAVEKTLANNPSALGALAASKYNVDNQTRGEEFRTNQNIANDISNKNIGIINDAKKINLDLEDKQIVRQAEAKAITQENRFRAAESVSDKISQNKRANMSLAMLEASEHYVFDPKTGTYNYIGPSLEVAPQRVNIQNPYPAREKTKQYMYDADGNKVEEKDTARFGGRLASRKQPEQKKKRKYIAK